MGKIKRIAKRMLKPSVSVWTVIFMMLQIISGALLPAPSFFPESLQTKTAQAATPSWSGSYGSWAYRKPIPVAGSASWGGAQTNYQVPVNPSIEEVFDKTGLVGDWNFDEGGGTVASDKSGSGNHGTMNGSSYWTSAGKYGSGFLGNGSSNYVSMTQSSQWDFTGSNTGTIEFWIKPNTLSGSKAFLAIGDSDPSANFIIYPQNSDTSKLAIGKWGTGESASATGVIQTGSWQHIVIVKTASDTKAYVNGNNVLTTTTNFFATGNLIIGMSGTSYLYDGSIDEVKIWNRALTADEVYKHYVGYANNSLVGSWHFSEGSGTTAADSSGQGNNGTLVNTPTPTTDKYGTANKALTFNGSTNYVTVADATSLNMTGALTVESWIKTSGTNDYSGIVEKYNTSTGYSGFLLNINSNHARFDIMSVSSYNRALGSVTLTDGQWHHVVGTYDGSVIKVYTDGVFESSTNFTGMTAPSGYPLYIGQDPYSASRRFNGTIDEPKIYNRALTASEIAERYRNSSEMRDDYGDLRFTNAAGTTLDYWQETDSKVWVEHNSISNSPDPTNNYIYEYYGNPSQASASNGGNTFDFFDDFESYALGSINGLGGWVVESLTGDVSNLSSFSGTKSVRIYDNSAATYNSVDRSFSAVTQRRFKFRYDPQAYTSGGGHSFIVANSANGYIPFDIAFMNNGSIAYYNGSGWTTIATSAFNTNGWNNIDFVAKSVTAMDVYVNGVLKGTAAQGGSASNFSYFGFGSWGSTPTGDLFYVDDVSQGKYISPEPTVGTTGAEQGEILDYTYKKNITFKTDAPISVTTSQNNFPVAVHLNTSSWPTQAERDSFFDNAGSTGKRVTFYDSDEQTVLPYEVEYFSNVQGSEEAIYWVKVPQINGGVADDKIVVAYGNDPYSADQDNPKKVWDGNFKGVWHLSEDVTDEGNGAIHYDSTSNYNNGSQNGNVEIAAQVYRGQDFDGSNDYISLPDIGLPESYPFTMTAYANISSGDNNWAPLIVFEGASTERAFLGHYSNRMRYNVRNGASEAEIITGSDYRGASHYFAGASSALNSHTIYVDGTSQGTNATSVAAPPVTSSKIGRWDGDPSYTAGTIDEVRISKIARSADWIKLEYYSMKKTNYNGDNDGTNKFITFGTQSGTIPNSTPDAPTSLAQYKSDCTTSISTGGWTNETTVCLKGYINDADTNDQVKIATEVTAGSLTGTPNFTASVYVTDPNTSSVSASGLVNGSQYKWQGRSLDDDAATSGFTQFNSGNLSFGIDTSAPAGGSITYTDGYYASLSVALTAADGTDSASGVNTASRITQRKSATLTNGTCGSYGSFATITPTGTYPNFTDSTVVTGNCYQYQYLVSDNATNQATYTSSNTAKIDTAAPTGGSITYTDGYYTSASVALTAADGTDAISGINTSSRITQRKSATLTNGVCGAFGAFGTISLSGTYPNFTDSTVTTGNCYQYQYLVSDNATNQATYTSSNTAKIDTTTPDIVAVDAGASSGDRTSLTTNTWFKYSDTGSDDQLSFSWTDPSSASDDTFFYELNASSGNTIDGTESSVTNPYVDSIAITEGTSYFHVRPRNGALTWGTERTFTVKYDKSGPTGAGIANITPDSTTQLTVSGNTAADSNSGLHTTPYYFENTTASTNSGWQVGTSWISSSLSPNTQYTFRVKSKDALENESGWSATQSKYTLASQVTGLSATDATTKSNYRINLTWTNQSQSGIKIEQDTGCDGYETTAYDNTSSTPATPYAINVSANTCYQFKISSYNGDGALNSVSIPETSQITTPPAQPTGLTHTANTTSTISWDWNDVSGATGYKVYDNSDDSLLDTISSATSEWEQDSLDSDTQYSIYVRATNANGEGIASVSASAYTSADTPINANHSTNDTNSINWTWDSGGSEKDFYAWTSTPDENSGWTTDTNWLLGSLSANELYQFFVKARNEEDDETGSASASKYTSQNIPTGITFDSVATNSITLSADGTFPNLSDDSSGLYFENTTESQNSGWLQNNEWINSSLNPNTEYAYKVRARNGDTDNTSYASEEQKYTLAETPATPTVNTPTINTLKAIINQNSNPAGTEYAIYEASTDKYVDSSDGSLQNSEDWQDYTTFGGASGITVTGLAENTTYAFRVKARNHDDIETSLSSSASGTTGNSPDAPTRVSPENGSLLTDTTPELSAHYADADTGDTGTTNYQITDTDAVDCLAGLNLVDSGSSAETITNDEDTTWTPGDLTDAEYFWCAQNSDGTNTSNWTTMGSFTLDTSTPDIVAVDAGASNADRISLTSNSWFGYAAAGSDDQISFSWTDPDSVSNDAFYYELNSESSNTIDGTEANTANPYLDNISISEGTSYLHVKPQNGALTWGTERIFIVKYDKSAPAGGSITYTGGYYNTTSITLTADDGTDDGSGTDAASRIFQRKEADLAAGACGAYGAFAGVSPTGVYPDYTDDTVTNAKCYQYQYSVSDNLANEATYANSNAAKIDTEDPIAPTTFSLGTVTAAVITASASGATDTLSGLHSSPYYYENTTAGTNSGWTADTDWQSADLSPNTTYTFRAKSRDAAGNESSYTADQSATTLANAPANLALAADTTNQITASWNANSNPVATEYYIENIPAGTNSGWIMDTGWISDGLAENTAYTFRVKARNADLVETSWSAEASEETLSSIVIDDDDDDDDNDHHKASQKINEAAANLPYYISNLPNLITEEINKSIETGKIEESIIPAEAPPVMKGEWNLLPCDAIGEFALSPLPEEIADLVNKFPQLQNTFNQLGITRLSDLSSLGSTELTLPGLSRFLEVQLPKTAGLPLAALSPELKEKIPAEIIFVKTAGEKIDININLTLDPQGKLEQRVDIISGKNIQLIVKPEQAVNNIKGYLVFKSNKVQSISYSPNSEPQVAGASSIIISLKDAIESIVFPVKTLAEEYGPKDIETRLVLSEFDYSDPDGDGIYTADIQTPVSEGEYEVITVMDYKDIAIGKKAIRLITVVDPEGYVYEKIKNSELRIVNAVVSLFWLNPANNNSELWPARNFQQENPQTTDATGKYSFLVPPGKYYLEVKAPDYKNYQSDEIVVQAGGGIHKNIELKKSFDLKDSIDWKTIALFVVIILLGYNFYRDRKNTNSRNP